MFFLLLTLLIESTAPSGRGVTEGIVVDKYPALAIGSQQPHIRRVKVIVVYDSVRDVRSEWVVDDQAYHAVVMGQRISRTPAVRGGAVELGGVILGPTGGNVTGAPAGTPGPLTGGFNKPTGEKNGPVPSGL